MQRDGGPLIRVAAPTIAAWPKGSFAENLAFDASGLVLGTTASAGEDMARVLPGARVVKAIPPFAEVLHSASTLIDGSYPGMFVCGDDADARAVILVLTADIEAQGNDAEPLPQARNRAARRAAGPACLCGGLGVRIGATLLRESRHD